MKTNIQTALLNRTVTIRTDLHLHQWDKYAGQTAIIASIFVQAGTGPQYTLLLNDGSLKDTFDWAFTVLPLPAAA